jgi:hypothetical protein
VKASDAVLWAFATWTVCGCAEGYGVPVVGRRDNAALAPMGGMESAAPLDGAVAEMSSGGTGGAAVPVGEPCVQGDEVSCPCEGTEAQGRRICRFDMASPMDGFLTECMGCPPPAAPPDPMQCSDGMQNGAETGSDCGGPTCMPCALGSACLVDGDCVEGTCVVGTCTQPATSGTGGMGGTGGGTGGTSGTGGTGGESGASGEGGTGGDDEPPLEGPVEDCDGVPEGTECDRDCILPSNTARCTSRGTCSCLG